MVTALDDYRPHRRYAAENGEIDVFEQKAVTHRVGLCTLQMYSKIDDNRYCNMKRFTIDAESRQIGILMMDIVRTETASVSDLAV